MLISPNTTKTTYPLVPAPRYTLQQWEFRWLKAIRQLTIEETDVRDYDMVGISVFGKHALGIKTDPLFSKQKLVKPIELI